MSKRDAGPEARWVHGWSQARIKRSGSRAGCRAQHDPNQNLREKVPGGQLVMVKKVLDIAAQVANKISCS